MSENRDDSFAANTADNDVAMDRLEEQEQIQKAKLDQMKKDEYKWYKIKMIASAVLIPIIYFVFFLIMKNKF